MSILNFPTSPSTGDLYVFGDYTYRYDGEKWTTLSLGNVATLRQDLANGSDPSQGAALVGYRNSTVKAKLDNFIAAEDFGWPTVEAGAAMNAAIAEAVASGIGEVRYHSPHYNQQTPIVLQNGVVIRGPGCGIEGEIRVAHGVAIEAQVMTPNFDTVYAEVRGSILNGVSRDCGLIDVFLNGNRQNVPSVSDWRMGLGVKAYWIRPVMRNVRIHRTPGIGFYSAYKSAGRVFPPGYTFPPNLELDIKDRDIFGVYINDTAYEGFVFEGPSDLPVGQIFVGWPGGSLYDTTPMNKTSLRFPGEPIDGFVVVDEGAEIGFVHSFNNAKGYSINFRTDPARYPRLRAEFLMGETSQGCLKLGGNWRYQIGRVDTHLNGFYGETTSPALDITTTRGGTISAFEDFRTGSTATAPSLNLAGENNNVYGGQVFAFAAGGDAVVVNGKSNRFTGTVFGSPSGKAALVTGSNISACNIDITTNNCVTAWRNDAGGNINSDLRLTNYYRDGSFATQFQNIGTITTAEWRGYQITSKSEDTPSGIQRSKQTVFATADATLTTQQQLTLSHNVVRTPLVSDCIVTVKPNSGATVHPFTAWVSFVTSTSVVVQVKFSAVGSGTASVQVDIG